MFMSTLPPHLAFEEKGLWERYRSNGAHTSPINAMFCNLLLWRLNRGNRRTTITATAHGDEALSRVARGAPECYGNLSIISYVP